MPLCRVVATTLKVTIGWDGDKRPQILQFVLLHGVPARLSTRTRDIVGAARFGLAVVCSERDSSVPGQAAPLRLFVETAPYGTYSNEFACFISLLICLSVCLLCPERAVIQSGVRIYGIEPFARCPGWAKPSLSFVTVCFYGQHLQ